MYVGADYYPEHWERKRWKTDAELMQQAGFNVVRLAEFAWVFMEPEEGRFEFKWLDDALALLAEHGIDAILSTPTAAMPAWVKEKYPEVMATRKEGQKIVWGGRKNNCFSSASYRMLSERITRAMAEHFAETPNVIGWQTDNEFGHPVCFCASCRAEFHAWLKTRYSTLDALNSAWGTHFWGHVIQDWKEIEIPDNDGHHNPSLCLDWHRFFSWQNVRFQREQIQVLRELCPKHFITHNFMGFFADLNYYDLAEDLDFVSWDNYPVWGTPAVHYGAAAAADVMRGLKKKNFWIMEQTAGPGGSSTFGRNPWPGEIRKVAYQQLAHGADGQVWFRWRTCTAGREQYWHGLLGHDGKPLRRYREAAATAEEYHKLADDLKNTTIKADVAMIYDYESIWAMRIQPAYTVAQTNGNYCYHSNYHQAVTRYYNALFRAGVGVDMIPPHADFSRYKIVLAPHLHILPDALAQRLRDFVNAGGTLLTDCRAAVKNQTNLCHERTLPGLLRDVLGVAIEEYEAAGEFPVRGVDTLDGLYSSEACCDWVTAEGAQVLADYDGEWHLKGMAAVTRNSFGNGTAYYVGTLVNQEEFYDSLIGDVLAAGGVTPVVHPPAGVEAVVREGDGRKLLFLINHTQETVSVPVPPGKPELLSGTETGPELAMARFGVAVIRL